MEAISTPAGESPEFPSQQSNTDPAKPLRNPKHEAFAQLQAEGKGGKEAYQTVYGFDRRSPASNASVLRRRGRVAARIRFLQTQNEDAAVMDASEILEFLTRVKRTKIGEVDPQSDVVKRHQTDKNGRKSVTMHDKRACVKLAAKLQGFLRKDKTVE